MFEILFDWIREGRRIPILGDGSNRYQLLAVEDLVDAVVRCFDAPVAGEALNIGAGRFGTVREDLEALAAHAGSGSRLGPFPPGRRSSLFAGSSWRGSRPSRSGTTGPGTRTPSSRSTRRSPSSGGSRGSPTPRRSARRTTGTSRTASELGAAGTTHRVPWDQRALGVLRRLS